MTTFKEQLKQFADPLNVTPEDIKKRCNTIHASLENRDACDTTTPPQRISDFPLYLTSINSKAFTDACQEISDACDQPDQEMTDFNPNASANPSNPEGYMVLTNEKDQFKNYILLLAIADTVCETYPDATQADVLQEQAKKATKSFGFSMLSRDGASIAGIQGDTTLEDLVPNELNAAIYPSPDSAERRNDTIMDKLRLMRDKMSPLILVENFSRKNPETPEEKKESAPSQIKKKPATLRRGFFLSKEERRLNGEGSSKGPSIG